MLIPTRRVTFLAEARSSRRFRSAELNAENLAKCGLEIEASLDENQRKFKIIGFLETDPSGHRHSGYREDLAALAFRQVLRERRSFVSQNRQRQQNKYRGKRAQQI